MEVQELPIWNGWTIDLRLRQFRKVEGASGIQFVDFDSEEGHELFHDYCQEKYEYHMETGGDYQRIQFDLEDGSFSSEDADILAQEIFNGAHAEDSVVVNEEELTDEEITKIVREGREYLKKISGGEDDNTTS